MNVLLEDATIRHERAILDLTERHRRDVAQRLDRVVADNHRLFGRLTKAIQELWATRGTTRPSVDKEHWFLLAREDTAAADGGLVVTFKIHSGQRAYIDRIGQSKDVVFASPAANGIDIRQSAKKRMRELTRNHDVSVHHAYISVRI
jgi:hypothetical protein